MKAIVTGGAGYLGSVLVPYLRDVGHEVVVMDALRYNQSVDGITYPCDSADPFKWGNFWKNWRPDVVINLAALVGEPLCEKYPEEAYRTNVDGTRLAAEWCNRHGAKLLQISTCSNYGVSESLATEESPLKPLGVYAETKVASEEETKKALNATILRLGTLYGPSPRMRWDTMINEWVYDYLRNATLDVYNPEAYRPFLHIEDACKAIQTVLDQPEKTNKQIFNVAGLNITKLDLASTITSVGECNYDIVERASDSRDYQVDTAKFSGATGFSYLHTLENLEEDLEEIRLFALVRKTNNAKDFVMPHD